MLFTVTTVIFNNRQFYKEYLMIAITDIVTNSNMQQAKNSYCKEQLMLYQVLYSTECKIYVIIT